MTSTLGGRGGCCAARPDLARLVGAGLVSLTGDWLLAIGLSVRRLRPDRLDDGLGRGVPDLAAAAGARRARRRRARRPLGQAPHHDRRQPRARGRAAAAPARRRRRADLGRLPRAGARGGRGDALRAGRAGDAAACRRRLGLGRAGGRERAQRPGPEPLPARGRRARRRAGRARRHPARRARRHRHRSSSRRCSWPGSVRRARSRPGAEPRRTSSGAVSPSSGPTGWRVPGSRSGPGPCACSARSG